MLGVGTAIILTILGIGLILGFSIVFEKTVLKGQRVNGETKKQNLLYGIGCFSIVLLLFWLATKLD